MSEIRTEILNVAEVISSAKLVTEIENLIGASWENPSLVLRDAFLKIDRVMIGKNVKGEIVGFSTWKIKEYKTFAALYIGIGAIEARLQGQGVGKTIIYGGIRSGLEELTLKSSHLEKFVWTTTGSPIGYLGLFKGFPKNFNPQPNGIFNSNILPILEILKAELGPSKVQGDGNPFILKSFSKKRYTPPMYRHLAEINAKEDIPLFSQNKIDEREGDRIILIFQI